MQMIHTEQNIKLLNKDKDSISAMWSHTVA